MRAETTPDWPMLERAMIQLTAADTSRKAQPDAAPGWSEEAKPDLDVMELFAAGLLVMDADLQVLRSNVAARQCLGASDEGFVRIPTRSLGGRGLEFRRMVRDAIARGVRSTLLLQPASSDAVICSILPIKGSHSPVALVALMPLNGGSAKVVPHLRSLYRLSNAEAEVAAAAASGMDVVQIAQSRNVSIHTLRAQVAAIKAKMGLSRMTEIAVTVGRIDAAVTWL
jgi:DNA-binding NarL/FixJ family response regulator